VSVTCALLYRHVNERAVLTALIHAVTCAIRAHAHRVRRRSYRRARVAATLVVCNVVSSAINHPTNAKKCVRARSTVVDTLASMYVTPASVRHARTQSRWVSVRACARACIAVCHCTSHTRQAACAPGVDASIPYSCGERCTRMYNCGEHRCQRKCHAANEADGTCGACPNSPAVLSHCACGKTPLSQLADMEKRDKCTDPIPTCGEPCARPFTCGTAGACVLHAHSFVHFTLTDMRHTCPSLCHTGDCAPCALTTAVRCRCGACEEDVPCTLLHNGEYALACVHSSMPVQMGPYCALAVVVDRNHVVVTNAPKCAVLMTSTFARKHALVCLTAAYTRANSCVIRARVNDVSRPTSANNTVCVVLVCVHRRSRVVHRCPFAWKRVRAHTRARIQCAIGAMPRYHAHRVLSW